MKDVRWLTAYALMTVGVCIACGKSSEWIAKENKCRSLYAQAKTHTDTLIVHSYPTDQWNNTCYDVTRVEK